MKNKIVNKEQYQKALNDGYTHQEISDRLKKIGSENFKRVEEVTACVVDYGTFISVSEKLAETMKKVYYYSPYEEEYQNIKDSLKGTGLEKVERLNNILDPDVFDTIDLFVFPDISFSGLQRHLRSLGKSVWGHMGGSDLELKRDFFLETLKKVKLPIINYQKIIGLDALGDYLRKSSDKWVKVNSYRGNMETWHHIDYEHSKRRLEYLNITFGSAKNDIVFIVQDSIETEVEIGYDGWCIDGKFPSHSFQGYEKKNELYIGTVMANDKIPKEIRLINDKMSPVLKDYGYRDWWATEIRVAKGVPYFIDPTPRMPGQTGEHQLESIKNFSEVVWYGANGIMVEPIFNWKYAMEATLHYEASDKDILKSEQWKTLDIPKQVRRWIKLYHYFKVGDIFHFTPSDSDEVGVIVGVGNSILEAIKNLNKNMDEIKDLPVGIDKYGFIELINCIQEAQDNGVEFGDGNIPSIKEIILSM